MAVKNFTIQDAELADGSVTQARTSAHVPFDAHEGPTASWPAVTDFVFQRDFSVAPGTQFFEAIVRQGKEANELEAGFNIEVQGETVHTWSIEEGTAIRWSLSQDREGVVVEELVVLARRASLDIGGEKVEFKYGPST